MDKLKKYLLEERKFLKKEYKESSSNEMCHHFYKGQIALIEDIFKFIKSEKN